MLRDYSDKIVTIIDNGSCIELARILSRYFKKVNYYAEWRQGGFPTPNYYYIGKNIPGINRIDEYHSVKEETDLFIFTDIYSGAEQVDLVKQGKKVYGTRMGENLEIYRDLLMDTMKELKMDVPPHQSVKGIKTLREYLKEHKEIWVKINKLRGATESFFSPDYELIETFLDELEHKLGASKEDITFFCFDNLPDMSELGIDTHYSNGYPSLVMAGIEIKDAGYVGCMRLFKELPECLRSINEKFDPVLKEDNWQGPISTEVRIDKDLKSYFIDMTARQPFLPSFSQWYNYENLPDLIYECAEGRAIDPEPRDYFVAEIIIQSQWAEKEALPIRIDKKVRDQVFIKNYTIRDDREDLVYVIPTQIELQEIGSVVGRGKTIDEAIESAKKACEGVHGIKIDFPFGALDKAKDQINELDKLKINFFDFKLVAKEEQKEEKKRTRGSIIKLKK